MKAPAAAEIPGWWLGGNPVPVYDGAGRLVGALDVKLREPRIGARLRASAPPEFSFISERLPSIDDCLDDTADFELIPLGRRYVYRALTRDEALLDRVAHFVPLVNAAVPTPAVFLAIDAERRRRSEFMMLSLLERLGEQLGVLQPQQVN